MTIGQQTTQREALRRWALGEIESQFFKGDDAEKCVVRELLESANEQRQSEGILFFSNRSNRAGLFDLIPKDAVWRKARLQVVESEFENLRTIRTPEWKKYSQGTYKLVMAAKAFCNAPKMDPRITSIRESLSNGTANLFGITLVADSLAGPYSIAEGHGRLIALYLDCVIRENHQHCTNEIEVMIGIDPRFSKGLY